jgi:hypothetical protein
MTGSIAFAIYVHGTPHVAGNAGSSVSRSFCTGAVAPALLTIAAASSRRSDNRRARHGPQCCRSKHGGAARGEVYQSTLIPVCRRPNDPRTEKSSCLPRVRGNKDVSRKKRYHRNHEHGQGRPRNKGRNANMSFGFDEHSKTKGTKSPAGDVRRRRKA